LLVAAVAVVGTLVQLLHLAAVVQAAMFLEACHYFQQVLTVL
jgi:hypothetical protein